MEKRKVLELIEEAAEDYKWYPEQDHELDLSKKQLTRTSFLPEIGRYNIFTSLDLSYNQLTSLPPVIGELTNLTSLDLSHNQLTSVPLEIGKLTNLTALYLSGNQLTFLPPEIAKLTNLTRLYLSDNRLMSLPAEIVKLTNLTMLYLTHNQLRTLPAEIGKLTNLTPYLSGNPLKSPPPEIATQGIEAIRTYFKSLEGEKIKFYEVKVLLLGDGGAGKTSLVKRIKQDDFDKNEPATDGIKIDDWEVKENKIKVHFWDFGGQEIMHATHKFFLSIRSLYILVLDGREEQNSEYWLKHIKTFGGDSPVLVVINKIDQTFDFDVDRRRLQDKYKNIKGFYRVSCAKGDGINVFSEALSHALANMKHFPITWARSWFNVKKQLEDMVDDYITYDKYKEMCEKEGLTEKYQDILIKSLHYLGVILYFKDVPLLGTYVLEPKWVTNAVYKIITSKQVAESHGVLRLDSLDEILKKKKVDDYYYPLDKYMFIINLMKKFELCYEIDEDTVLLPNSLEDKPPEFDFDDATSLKFVIGYDFLLKSVMPRFIVKRHEEIKNKLQWKTGVVLENKDFHSTALIKADKEDKKINIYVNGEQKRDYLSTIRKEFRDISGRLAKELVPLPDNDKITIEYEELIGYELAGKDEYYIGKLRKGYSVKKLLNGIENEEERKGINNVNRTNIYAGELIMGDKMRDKYTAGQAGAIGPGAHAHDMTFNQIWNEAKEGIDLSILTRELAELRSKLKDEATEPEHDTSIGAIASAESSAKEGNGPKALEYLSKAGKWAFDKATKIGVPVATKALMVALGL